MSFATNMAASVEVDMGSTGSGGRPPEPSWLVRLRRDQNVIVAIGLRRGAADRLAEKISDLLR